MMRAVSRTVRFAIRNPVRFIRSVRYQVGIWYIKNFCKKAGPLSEAERAKLLQKMRELGVQMEAEYAQAFADAAAGGRLTTAELQYLLDNLENIVQQCTECRSGYVSPEQVIKNVIAGRPENIHGVPITDPAAWQPVPVGPGVSPSSSTVDVPPPGGAPASGSGLAKTDAYTSGFSPGR
jgi:hypothetical protein